MSDPLISIVMPTFKSPTNTRALTVALDCIARNTTLTYELLVMAHQDSHFYDVANLLIERARSEYVILTVDDQFVAPGWDTAFWERRDPSVLLTSSLVECGYLPVAEQCLRRNFGMSPESYERESFEHFASARPVMPRVDSWVLPWMVHRNTFLQLGGFDVNAPTLADCKFWQYWRMSGRAWRQVPSYSYHLQQWQKTGDKR